MVQLEPKSADPVVAFSEADANEELNDRPVVVTPLAAIN